ncbi:MAG: metal ABC transporter permease [Treponema sp.]|nr:metal ABC transporter permease [Candidatus Treponema equifaecale]
MTELFETLRVYFSFSFVLYAFIAGIMIAIVSSLLGVILVLKRFSYIGDGLSHTAFGAMALASVLKISHSTIFVLPVTVLFAMLILCAGENSKIKGDASVAMISTGALAVGYFLMNIFSPPANLSGDVCSTLFGSTLILTLTKSDTIFSVIIAAFVIVLFLYFYNRIFGLTFDEDFAHTCGTNTKIVNIVFSAIVAAVIVLAMNLVGTLLISALIIFPSVSSMMVFRSFKRVTICSCAFSIAGTVIGLFVSVISGTPVGSTIVVIDIAIFAVCSLISKFRSLG